MTWWTGEQLVVRVGSKSEHVKTSSKGLQKLRISKGDKGRSDDDNDDGKYFVRRRWAVVPIVLTKNGALASHSYYILCRTSDQTDCSWRYTLLHPEGQEKKGEQKRKNVTSVHTNVICVRIPLFGISFFILTKGVSHIHSFSFYTRQDGTEVEASFLFRGTQVKWIQQAEGTPTHLFHLISYSGCRSTEDTSGKSEAGKKIKLTKSRMSCAMHILVWEEGTGKCTGIHMCVPSEDEEQKDRNGRREEGLMGEWHDN